MPDDSMVPIKHVSVDKARETLGVVTCPSGKAKKQIKAVQTKAQKWLDSSKEGKLRRCDVWLFLDHQLWSKAGHGPGSITGPWQELDGCMNHKWWQLVPMGGLICTGPSKMRELNVGFYGAGVGIECMIAQVNKLLMHYGCASNNGLELKISL